MSKLTVQQVKDCGWNASQFDQVPDFDTEGGFLARLVGRAGRELADRISLATYAAAEADSVNEDRLIEGELAWVEERLWRMRASQFDGSASHSLDDSAYLTQRQYLANAEACADRFESMVGKITTGSPALGSGLSTGVVETGRYPKQNEATT